MDTNTFNFQDYTQGQTFDLSSFQSGTQVDNTQIDPSTFIQGDNAVLQASAGLENITSGNVDYFQNNTFQTTNYDTNAIFGENKTTNEIPETFGQTFQGTTTTNVIEGNNYFGDNNAIDINSYLNNNNNFDTNAIFGQTQGTTTNTTTTTTTNYDTLFGQTQDIQGTTTYGETQIIPGTDTNTFFGTTQVGETVQNQIEYGQPSNQNEFVTYQTTGTTDLNNFNFGTTNTTQTTTTTNAFTEPQTIPQYQTQNYTQGENTFNTTALPITETQYIPSQSQYNNAQQILESIPVTTSTLVNQPQTQTQTLIPSPGIEATYTPLQPIPQPQVQTTQVTAAFNQPKIQEQIPKQPQMIQQKKNLIIDEDFRRGRPIYSDLGNKLGKLRVGNQPNLITYRVRNVTNHDNIGLSRLTPAISYDRNVINPSSLNPGINPAINSNIGNLNNQINTFSNNLVNNTNNVISNVNNVGNALNNVNNNINTGLDKITKASSYNIGANTVTPLLNNF